MTKDPEISEKTANTTENSAKTPKKSKEKAPTDKLADRTAMTKFLQGIFDAQFFRTGDAGGKVNAHLLKHPDL